MAEFVNASWISTAHHDNVVIRFDMQDALRDTRRGESKARRGHGGVTLADVAKIARVSPITVSRVLSNPRLVAEETAAQVQRVIARTGYVPNRLAGGLASSKTRLVTAIVPTMANQVFAQTVEAFREELLTAGYQLMVGLSGYGDSQEDNLLNAVISRRPDGILLTGVVHSPMLRRQLASARIPVIETSDITPTPIDMLVGFSHEKVGRAVAEHLIASGRRRLGLILADDQRAQTRRQGFTEVVAAHGWKLSACEVVPAPSTVHSGRECLARILDDRRGVDADFLQLGFVGAGRPSRSLRARHSGSRRARGDGVLQPQLRRRHPSSVDHGRDRRRRHRS